MTLLKNNPQLKKYLIQSVIAVLIITAVLVIDLVTKTVADEASVDWVGRSKAVIDGFFYITYVRNTGAAWSFGADSPVFQTIVKIFTFVVLAVISLFIFWYKKKNTLFIISLAMIFGGAAGNLIDRLAFGYVRDLFDFIIFGYDFPVFNIADSALVVGVILMIIWLIFFFRPSDKKQETPSDDKTDKPEDMPE